MTFELVRASVPRWRSSSLRVAHGDPFEDREGGVDLLTGLVTRRTLIDRMHEVLEAAPDGDAQPCLILLDLDRFKSINDGLGPAVGDALLCRVADRLRSIARAAIVIARVSGDGFAVLVSDAGEAASLAARILEFIGRPYAVRGHAVVVTASLGIACAGEHGRDPLELLHAADLAMHEAERDGRNRICRFEPTMQERALSRHALESDLRAAMTLQQVELRRALVSEQFEVHYQPQVGLAHGRPTGLEALVRWRHPERGMVSPADFIPLAEDIGLIELLGDWVLRRACRDAASWPCPTGGQPLRVAVNVSPRQLLDGRVFLSGVRRALDESGLPPGRLELEVTESALSGEIGTALGSVRRLGIGLALDDFGTGYSSLGRLRHYPFDRIKIDRSFIADVSSSSDGGRRRSAEWMIRAIASLGQGLNLQTIIEGVETAEQLALARAASCTEMQGYLVSRPVPGNDVPPLLARLMQSNLIEGTSHGT